MFETDLQAQFLIPMAITMVFGLLVATLLVLFVVPALIAIQDDFARIFRRGSYAAAPMPAVAVSSMHKFRSAVHIGTRVNDKQMR